MFRQTMTNPCVNWLVVPIRLPLTDWRKKPIHYINLYHTIPNVLVIFSNRMKHGWTQQPKYMSIWPLSHGPSILIFLNISIKDVPTYVYIMYIINVYIYMHMHLDNPVSTTIVVITITKHNINHNNNNNSNRNSKYSELIMIKRHINGQKEK